MPMTVNSRIDVLGSRISAVDLRLALERLDGQLSTGQGGYVCFTNVHAVVMGVQDAGFQGITNSSLMSLADGKPVYWVARSRGPVSHLAGPDFMLEVLRQFRERRHFFYGSTPEVLDKLQSRLRATIPGLNICGTISPPFRMLSERDKAEDYSRIRNTRADFVWVGLGAPKQEKWMAEASESLRPAILLGVGAAFDFHSGTLARAPQLLRSCGLEWLYRLSQQPKHLFKRYLKTNTLFLKYLALDFSKRARGRERP